MKRLGKLLSILIICGLSAGVAYGAYSAMQKLPIIAYFDHNQLNAVWDWRNPSSVNTVALGDRADQLKTHQINAVFVDVSDTSEGQSEAMAKGLESYVKVMNQRDIQVYAAAGNQTWADPAQAGKAMAVLKFVQQYNLDHPNAQVAGLQYDIESYNQPEFIAASIDERSPLLVRYLELVNGLVKQQQTYLEANSSSKMTLGFTAPYWLDNENGNIKSVDYNSKNQAAAYHVMDMLNRLPKGYLVVMAYRNAALGNDGTIAHTRQEISYADAVAPKVKVIVGQEAGDFQPAKITFYGYTKSDLTREARVIVDEYSQTTAFGGFAINDINSYFELKN